MSEPVTKEQCEFFRGLYEAQERVSLQLEGRAKVYLGVISAVLAAVLLKAADAKAVAETLKIPWVLLLLEALAMTCALLLVLWSLRWHRYDAANDGIKLMKSYSEVWPDEADFNKEMAIDYAVASSRNRIRNEGVAKTLTLASFFMMSGILLLFGIVCVAIGRAL
jgi:hypothetical protein